MTRVRAPGLPRYEPLLLVFGMILLLFLGRTLIIPLAFAVTLSFVMLPAVHRLEQLRLPRPVAVAGVGAIAAVILLLGAYVVARQVLTFAEELPSYRDNMHSRIASLHSPAETALGRAAETLREVTGDLSSSGGRSAAEPAPVRLVQSGGQLAFASEVVNLTLRPIAQVGIVVVFAMYILMKREELRRRLLMLAGTGQLGLMTRALDEAAGRISRYLVMQFQVNACYGLLFGFGLYCLHIPNAILWGVIAGSIRIVPYVGTGLGVILPFITAIAVSASWWPPLLVLAWFVGLESILAYFVEPKLFSSHTGISSLALLASAIFWTMLWGWPGLVLSTPMTVCVVVMGQYVPQLSFLHSLLGTDVQLSPAAHFYERLLATDHTEAYAIANRFLRDHSLVSLYDGVLIRALSLVEEDRHRGTLDDARSHFILLTVGELVARLADLPEDTVSAVDISSRADRIQTLRSSVLKEIAVVCISAGDAADKLTTQMLAQLLEQAHFQVLVLTADALSDEILDSLAVEKDTVFVISALPPFAFAEVRSICQRVRHHVTDNRIVIALWNSKDDQDDLVPQFGSCRPNAVVGNLAQALDQVSLWQEATRMDSIR